MPVREPEPLQSGAALGGPRQAGHQDPLRKHIYALHTDSPFDFVSLVSYSILIFYSKCFQFNGFWHLRRSPGLEWLPGGIPLARGPSCTRWLWRWRRCGASSSLPTTLTLSSSPQPRCSRRCGGRGLAPALNLHPTPRCWVQRSVPCLE